MKTALSLVVPFALVAVAACAVGTGDPVDLSPSQTSAPTDPEKPSAAPAHAATGDAAGASDAAAADDGDAGDSGDGNDASATSHASTPCSDYADPTLSATCHACGTKPCQPNGCYSGYWCNTLTNKCTPKPAACP